MLKFLKNFGKFCLCFLKWFTFSFIFFLFGFACDFAYCYGTSNKFEWTNLYRLIFICTILVIALVGSIADYVLNIKSK